MAQRSREIASHIRRILDGVGAGAAKRALVEIGGPAVEPILQAATGKHGKMHPDQHEVAMDDFIAVLVRIAKVKPAALAAALAHHVPGEHLAAYALGHSRSRHARQVLEQLRNDEDNGLRAVAEHHLQRHKRRRPAR